MFFDALTIAAVRDELTARVGGGRVQQVRAVGPLAISLEIYAQHRRAPLLFSAHAQNARVHLLAHPPSRDPGVQTPFLLLLRKYVRGATLQTIEQPQFERVLTFTFTKVLPVARHGADLPDEPEELDEPDPALEARLAEIPPGFALFSTRLIAEIMGRHSNLILVNSEGEILDAVKRIPGSLNRVRTTLPHQRYVPPPPQRKLDLRLMPLTGFQHEISSLDPATGLWQALVARFSAVSPLLAQEAVFRAGGDEQSPVSAGDPARVYAALRGLLDLSQSHAWAPCLAWEGVEGGGLGAGEEDGADGDEDQEAELAAPSSAAALAFAPYPLTHLAAEGARLEEPDGISRAAEQFYAALEQISGHAQLRADIAEEIDARRKTLARRAAALERELERAAGFDVLRRKGEMLLGYMYVLEPGQRRLEIPEEDLVIDLDPDVPPLEQAQAMFREYSRARAAVAGVPARLEATGLALQYLDELTTHLELAEDFATISAIREELAALPADPDTLVAGIERRARGEEDGDEAPPPPKKAPKGRGKYAPKTTRAKKEAAGRAGIEPLRVTSSDGIPILVGRSARQNDAITFGQARPGDLWLHARNVPGAHVVVRSEGRTVPERTVAEAARLAAQHSKARHDTAVDVIITERRHVRRIPGAPPGLVTVSGERVLRVRPAAAREEH
jgi:predicted ribosome quality control (RQC) complex YloA/Tae2 family protein